MEFSDVSKKDIAYYECRSEPDREVLCDWIKKITRSSGSSAEQWEGHRNMIDMRDLFLKYYFNPLTGGSNSIKRVLHAVLENSDFLKSKYSLPVYGNEIKSLNFKDQKWIKHENGTLINPYSLLPFIHPGASNEALDEFIVDEESGIADGGAAMIAFARMQFTEVSEAERKNIIKALLRYYELDTLAMVMIYEAWKEWCK